MKLVLRKLDVEGIEQLESLVTEHIDSIEPGLRVVDSRLFLGHATIDVVALDASGSLVLVVLGFQADEHLLLQVVEAYSWCLEYPDTVRRHYPSVRVSEERPPRVMFVIDRISDAFTRKIKQLNFAAVDCVEYRHIDVNGIPAMYFETVARVRRGALASATRDVVAAPPQIIKAAAPRESKVVPLNGHAAEPARVRMIEIPTEPARAEALGELIAATAAARHANGIAGGSSDHVAVIERPIAAAPAPVIAAPVVAAAAPVIERPVAVPVVAAPAPVVAAPAPVVAPTAPVVAAPAPVAAAPAPVIVAPAPVVAAPAPIIEAPVVVAAVAPPVEPPVAVAPVPVAQPEVVAVAPAPIEEPETVAAVAPAPIAEPEIVVEAPAAPVAAAPEPQKEEVPERGRISFAQAVKGQEIGGLQFPKDGALTRQWIEFLNQLSAK